MRLYIISTNANDRFNAFSRAVVAAETEEDARKIHPDGRTVVADREDYLGAWVPLSQVEVDYLGDAKPDTKPGVILASYISG